MTQIYKYLLSDSSKNSTFIPTNSANNSIFALVFDLILDSRLSNSTLIFQFCDSALTRLRLQSFDIRLDDDPLFGTPLRRYLKHIKNQDTNIYCLDGWGEVVEYATHEKVNRWGLERGEEVPFTWF